MKLTDSQCAEVLDICHARNAARAGKVFDAAPSLAETVVLPYLQEAYRAGLRDGRGRVRDEAQAGKGAAYWVKEIAELLTAMMKDPAMASMFSSAAPGGGTPPEVPSARNPTGESGAPKLPGIAADSLDALLPKAKAKPVRTLADLVNVIRKR
jgi:hypothetical protein